MTTTTLTRTPDPPTAKALVDQIDDEIRLAPSHTLGLKMAARRLLNAFLSVWAANRWLLNIYQQTKIENAGLYHFLAATITRYGELRFTKEELDAQAWGKRVRGYCVPGSTDVIFRVSDEPLLTQDSPAWLGRAVEGLPVPELIVGGEQLFLPVFDITDLDGTKPKPESGRSQAGGLPDPTAPLVAHSRTLS